MGGLWAGRTTQQGDFATVTYRAQLLGFNAVRIPFRFSDLNLPPKNWTFPCSVDRLGDIKVPTPLTRTLLSPPCCWMHYCAMCCAHLMAVHPFDTVILP